MPKPKFVSIDVETLPSGGIRGVLRHMNGAKAAVGPVVARESEARELVADIATLRGWTVKMPGVRAEVTLRDGEDLHLERLCDRWGCTRQEALRRAVMLASRQEELPWTK